MLGRVLVGGWGVEYSFIYGYFFLIGVGRVGLIIRFLLDFFSKFFLFF